MSQNIIIWQKWVDPFGEDIDNTPIASDGLGDFLQEEESNIDNFTQEDLEEDIKHIARKHSSIKVIATPMGIIPMNENTASGKIFNFWLGHTNFSLTKNLVDKIEYTDGVETLDIFTRYRFRVAIGKAFIDSDVMRNINNNVYGALNHVK